MFTRQSLASFFENLFSSNRQQSSMNQNRGHPQLEVLEDRTVPAVYTWNAAADGLWSDANNWDSTAAGIPDDSNDVAVFDGGESVKNVTVQLERTIGELSIKNNFTGEIRLAHDLIVKNGGVSRLDSDFKIAPQNIASDLIFDSAQAIIHQGTVGSTTHESYIKVINGAILTFDMKSSVHVGMNLLVGDAAGGVGKGTVYVQEDTNGYNNRHLMLDNDVKITINKDSTLYLDGKDGDASIKALPNATKIVKVYGDLYRRGSGTVELQLPVLVEEDGELRVTGAENNTQASTLYIKADGVVGTHSASLYAYGDVHLGNTNAHMSLKVSDEIIFDGNDDQGRLYVVGDSADLDADDLIDFFRGAELRLNEGSTAQNPKFTDLDIYFSGANAKLNFLRGTLFMDVSPTDGDWINVQGGDIHFSNETDYTLEVKEYGDIIANDSVDIIDVPQGTINGDFGNKTFNPAGAFSTSIVQNGGDIYRLTKKAVCAGGCGGASVSGRLWDDVNSNGIQDATETTGFAGVMVYLYDSFGTEIANTTTASDGSYSFSGLDAGDYSLSFTMIPFDYEFTTQNAPGSNETNDSDVDFSGMAYFTLSEDEIKDDLDAGLVSTTY